jgi:3-deoxy-manno-octulosonate cytidylyltransferase (CMP-KDO synthetase)
MSDPLIIIPARMSATRLPGKPLADICGEPMIVHVWRRAIEAGIGEVLVAADAPQIIDAIEKLGGKAILTRPDHASGSDRIYEALMSYDPNGVHDIIVNIQGDLPTIDPISVAASILPLADAAVDMTTICAVITQEEEKTNPNVVKLVGSKIRSNRLRALYFTERLPLGVMANYITILDFMLIAGAF